MKICISNLGSSVTDDSLSAIFSTYGYVQASVMVEKDAPENRRMAILDMPNEAEASRAIEKLDGRFIDGHIIEVRQAASVHPVF